MFRRCSEASCKPVLAKRRSKSIGASAECVLSREVSAV